MLQRHRLPLAALLTALAGVITTAASGCGSSATDVATQDPDASAGGSAGAAGAAGVAGAAGAAGVGGKDASQEASNPDTGPKADAPEDSPKSDGPLEGDAQSAPDVLVDADAAAPVADPAKDGPYATTNHDSVVGSMSVRCAVPDSGPTAGPYPVVMFAHGFMIEPFRYSGYVERLGTFGYVACLVGYSSFQGQDQDPKSISDVLDWAISESGKTGTSLSDKVDATHAGVMGHSRGGKAAVNAAAQDPRFLAVLGIDPVNTCPMGTCPDAIQAMDTLAIPSAFVGETTDDGDGGASQPCAPAADNFQQFYSHGLSPSLSVNVLGANHMSFLTDATGCAQCLMCSSATADHAVVLDLAYAYTVAFFERRLRGDQGYDPYLTGAMADQRYVQTGLATIVSK